MEAITPELKNRLRWYQGGHVPFRSPLQLAATRRNWTIARLRGILVFVEELKQIDGFESAARELGDAVHACINEATWKDDK